MGTLAVLLSPRFLLSLLPTDLLRPTGSDINWTLSYLATALSPCSEATFILLKYDVFTTPIVARYGSLPSQSAAICPPSWSRSGPVLLPHSPPSCFCSSPLPLFHFLSSRNAQEGSHLSTFRMSHMNQTYHGRD